MPNHDSVQRIARRVDALLRDRVTRPRLVRLAIRGLREEAKAERPNGAELFPDDDVSVERAALRLVVLRDAVCDGARILKTATPKKHAIESSRDSFRSAIRDLPALVLIEMARPFGDDPFTGKPASSWTRRERVEARRWMGQVEAALRPTGAAGHHPVQHVKRADELTQREVADKFDIPQSALSKARKLEPGAYGYLPSRCVRRAVFIRREDAERFAKDYDARRETRAVKSLHDCGESSNSLDARRRRKARS